MRSRTKIIIYIIFLIAESLLLIAGYVAPNWWCDDDQNSAGVDGSARGGVYVNSTDPRVVTSDGKVTVNGSNPVVVVIQRSDGK